MAGAIGVHLGYGDHPGKYLMFGRQASGLSLKEITRLTVDKTMLSHFSAGHLRADKLMFVNSESDSNRRQGGHWVVKMKTNSP